MWCGGRFTECLELTTAETFMQMPTPFFSQCCPSPGVPLLLLRLLFLSNTCLGQGSPLKRNISHTVPHSLHIPCSRGKQPEEEICKERRQRVQGTAWKRKVMPGAGCSHLRRCEGPERGGLVQLHRLQVASFHHESTNKGNCRPKTLLIMFSYFFNTSP